ncbi:Uncharacterized membrane protein YgcG, contains a TPM-fold domain [Geodermatophilus pulveris]|uniref:Uncharacterized membrane protein YgcG, contains a TPM-fold domain n=1 Tax=Geodermatophilus pulveris TaxID=1564159 RepID=A0A239J6C6_9ACTN|nr:TPM domain-containing protein [Geodermatophilus pulveris]SNT01380.1 Uncharacterized membrane protein YgcG, contains a TPM-fold domain [Geodermatophilus pulveris]
MSRAVVVTGVLALALSVAGPARAAPPLQLTDRVTDQAGALGDDAAAAREAAQSLAEDTGVGLYVVFVPSFDAVPPETWAERTAELSALEPTDVLLTVAVGEGEGTYEYSWWVDDATRLSGVAVEAAMTGEIEPRLAAGDRSGAVVELAGQLRPLARAAEEATTATWSGTTTAWVVAAVAVVLLAGHLLSRRRSTARPTR